MSLRVVIVPALAVLPALLPVGATHAGEAKTAPTAPAPARTKDVAARFDLTGAEAQLAAAFVHGESLNHHAVRRGSSLSTVRNQFAALRGKLGAHDQADVVRKVPLGSPPTPFLVDKP